MILALSLWFHWVPPVEYASLMNNPTANLEQMILPALVLGTVVAAQVMRMTRSALLEVLRNDYVRTARAKGLAEQLIVRRHAFRNALIPIITVVGLQVGFRSDWSHDGWLRLLWNELRLTPRVLRTRRAAWSDLRLPPDRAA